jgi:hypothetical protein
LIYEVIPGHPKILYIAVDFDGTLCSNEWPHIGYPNRKLIDKLIYMRLQGHKITLFSCREGKLLDDAVEWCKYRGLEFHSINTNAYNFDHGFRKVVADITICDKSCLPDQFYDWLDKNWNNKE